MSSIHRSGGFGATLAILIAACCCWSGQAQNFSVSPGVITNDYIGQITLTITNLSAGQSVIVERYLDVNNNGAIEAAEWLVQRFAVTDGSQPLVGGVRNINVPGDDDGVTNGQITVRLNYPGLNATLDTIAGHVLYRLVDPNGVFTTVTSGLTVRQKAFAQGVTGTAYGNGHALTNAVVIMLNPNGNGGVGTVADTNGNFAISNAPGNYGLVALANGFVANQNAGTTVSSNAFATLNLTNVLPTTTLSGKVSDISSGKGLAGIFTQAEATNGGFTALFTDTNGNFALPATASEWKLQVSSDSGIAQAGYVAFNNSIRTNTFGGSVSNLNFAFPKGTALIYGQVLDNLSNAVGGLGVQGQDASFVYETRGLSTTNGNYALAVFAGDWAVGPDNNDLAARGLLGQNLTVTVSNNQAVLQNIQLQHITAHLRGHFIKSDGSPLGNADLALNFVQTNGFTTTVNSSLQTGGDGSFDVGVYAGTWNLALDCGAAIQNGVVSPSVTFTMVNGVDSNNITLIAPIATGMITGSVIDSHGNPVDASVYASLTVNGTNYNACGNNNGNNFQIPVFNGVWQLGISGDLTSRGYDNPPNQLVNVTGTNTSVNIVVYPLGQTPPRLSNYGFVAGQFQFTLTGDTEQKYRIDVTTNLSNPTGWVTLRTNVAFGGTFTFTDTNSPAGKSRFYRAVWVP